MQSRYYLSFFVPKSAVGHSVWQIMDHKTGRYVDTFRDETDAKVRMSELQELESTLED